jgi:hypothetical protein
VVNRCQACPEGNKREDGENVRRSRRGRGQRKARKQGNKEGERESGKVMADLMVNPQHKERQVDKE